MPSDETRYYERATNYRELAEQATRPELKPVYLHLAAGYDRLAQFHEDVRVLLAPVGAPLGGVSQRSMPWCPASFRRPGP